MEAEVKIEPVNQVAVVTRLQRRQQNANATDAYTNAVNDLANIDPNMATNDNMVDNEDDQYSYDDNKEALSQEAIPDKFFKTSDTRVRGDSGEPHFVILNSRTAHGELTSICDLPHGMKDHKQGNTVMIPEEKIWGMVLDGKSN